LLARLPRSISTLGPSYSCRTPEEFRKGYRKTALFLSGASKQSNCPELLFNGSCNAPDYFQGQTAGDDFDVMADYGDVRLDELTASRAFPPLRRTDSPASATPLQCGSDTLMAW
jgi:hypothetical protein